MTDAQVRFLRAIAAAIPVDRIVEVHVFPAIRQGVAETGAAVVAADMEPVPLGEAGVVAAPEPGASGPATVAVHRHTIYSARYRLTIKGIDRGTWECDVVAEADAPLVTMDAVVRGVQERSGEAVDPERLSTEQFRMAISDTPWATEP